jgi:hypothetical protein
MNEALLVLIEDQAYQTQTEDTPKYIDTEDLEALNNPE